jgi:hypothetical protein
LWHGCKIEQEIPCAVVGFGCVKLKESPGTNNKMRRCKLQIKSQIENDMGSKEEKDQLITEETRRRIVNGRFQDCPCKDSGCPRHGICFECTAVHRNNRSSVPACLRIIAERKQRL